MKSYTNKEKHMNGNGVVAEQELISSTTIESSSEKPQWLIEDEIHGQRWYLVRLVVLTDGTPSYYGPFKTVDAAEDFQRKATDELADEECDLRQLVYGESLRRPARN